MNRPTDSDTASRSETTATDSVYDNSAETGVVQGAQFDQDNDVAATEGQHTNAGGLSRTNTGAGASTLSDNVTGNNSMGTSTIGGGLGVGSSNSNSTLS